MNDADLLAQQIADDEGIEIESSDRQPDHAPPKSDGGGWRPRLNPGEQTEIFYDETSTNIVGVGPKGTAKTYGFLHRIVRHCFEENNALALIIGVSQRIASEGAGYDLVNAVLPTWRDGNRYPNFLTGKDGRIVKDRQGKGVPHPRAGELMDDGIGLEYTEWKLDPVTKDRHLWIANRHGGWSKVLLVSIQHASEVKSKMYGIQPSLVYIEELMNCGGEEYYKFTKAQLNRRRGIQGPQVWMASQNTESPKHWTYKLLYETCVVGSGGRVWKNDPEKPGIRRNASWGVYYVWFRDNEHNLPAGYMDTLMEAFASDPILLDRMLKARWIDYPDGEALFKGNYKQAVHLHGSAKSGRGLVPSPEYPIVVGLDPGQVHTGISFLQSIPVGGSENLWPVFDELCWFGERIPYIRATRWLLEKMRYWNERVGEPFDYRFISGDDAVTVFQPNRGSTIARDIEEYSRQIIAENPDRYAGLQPIRIIGCPKPPGSVAQRSALVMDLLDDDLLAVSAVCEWHDQMFLRLIRAKDAPMEPARGKYIHTFDSMSYPIYYQRYVLKGLFTSSKNAKPAIEVSIR
jgi:hypothetical protein